MISQGMSLFKDIVFKHDKHLEEAMTILNNGRYFDEKIYSSLSLSFANKDWLQIGLESGFLTNKGGVAKLHVGYYYDSWLLLSIMTSDVVDASSTHIAAILLCMMITRIPDAFNEITKERKTILSKILKKYHKSQKIGAIIDQILERSKNNRCYILRPEWRMNENSMMVC